jgi:hypothetical protein
MTPLTTDKSILIFQMWDFEFLSLQILALKFRDDNIVWTWGSLRPKQPPKIFGNLFIVIILI